jgi:hypothetical protein
MGPVVPLADGYCDAVAAALRCGRSRRGYTLVLGGNRS